MRKTIGLLSRFTLRSCVDMDHFKPMSTIVCLVAGGARATCTPDVYRFPVIGGRLFVLKVITYLINQSVNQSIRTCFINLFPFC